MMPVGKLTRMVAGSMVRNRGEFALSALGIMVGIAAFVFFLGLSGGVRAWILGEDLFPLERLEVIAPKTNIGITFAKRLDDGVVERIRERPEVRFAIPRMQLTFPAKGTGNFDGKDIKFEVGGFCDGIDASFVDTEEFAELFRDWETEEYLATAEPCLVKDKFVCKNDELVCGDKDRLCHPIRKIRLEPGQVAVPLEPCKRVDDFYCEEKQHHYCDERDKKCHHRVPVIVSPKLLEIFNSSFAEPHGLPKINTNIANFIRQRGGYSRMRFTIGLGKTYVTGSNTEIKAKPRDVEGYLVGINNKAIDIGLTVPIQYVAEWNREYQGDLEASTYSSIVVVVNNKDQISPFSSWLRSTEKLELEDSVGERFAQAIFGVTMLFLLISFVIVLISAINIAHTFFMQVSDRRREIGLLRAVGATQTDVRLIILGEAALIGLIGGAVGVGVAIGAAALWDSLIPDFLFRPATFFEFTPLIVGGGLGFAVLFCIIGGFLPARRAARMEPAQALAAQ